MKYAGVNFSLLLVDEFNLLPGISESCSFGKESLTQKTNPFGVTSEQNSPIGIERGVIEIGGGYYDASLDGVHGSLGGTLGTNRQVSAAIEGNVIGKHFMGFSGAYDQSFMLTGKVDDLTMGNAKYVINGLVEEGVIVQHLATFTATWDTKTGGSNATDAPVDYTLDPQQTPIPITSNSIANPTVITCPIPHRLTSGQIILISGVSGGSPTINGQRTVTVINSTTFSVPVNATSGGTGGQFVLASTVSGGAGYLHVTGLTVTSLANKIMHSPDDITYATLVTFPTLTAVGKQRVVVTGTVDRYLSNQGTVVGAGNVTAFSGFCRY
jgi:hypothetical protein